MWYSTNVKQSSFSDVDRVSKTITKVQVIIMIYDVIMKFCIRLLSFRHRSLKWDSAVYLMFFRNICRLIRPWVLGTDYLRTVFVFVGWLRRLTRRSSAWMMPEILGYGSSVCSQRRCTVSDDCGSLPSVTTVSLSHDPYKAKSRTKFRTLPAKCTISRFQLLWNSSRGTWHWSLKLNSNRTRVWQSLFIGCWKTVTSLKTANLLWTAAGKKVDTYFLNYIRVSQLREECVICLPFCQL